MQPFRFLTEQIAVAAQLQPEDLQRAQAAGFKSIINNRPDFEEAGQPENGLMRSTAERLGLEYHFLPVLSGDLTDDDVEEFGRLLPQLELPALMFCRSGTRCTHLWALACAGEQEEDRLVRLAGQAGYDLAALVPRLRLRKADAGLKV